MCHELPKIDPYVTQVSKRVVGKFELYAQNIDPEDEDFITFISEYLMRNNVKDPRAIPYLQLYRQIREGIREYLRQRGIQTERG